MKRIGFLGLTLLLGSTAAVSGECTLESIRSITPPDAVIDSVTPIGGTAAHCEVVGHIITDNPGPNRVEWTVMLPDRNFNNRYYFIGQGAAAGYVPTTSAPTTPLSPLAAYYAPATWKLLSEGFAVAGSDTGHKGLMWDFGIDNPAQRLDHGHRGAHVSAVATQAITRAYYAMEDKLYRYHLGCSGGGRMGAMALYHHPEDYDGVVASTGFGGGGTSYFAWIIQHVVNHPEGWISPAKLAFLEEKVAEHCAGPDGLVRDPDSCGFDPATLQCASESRDDCLTKAEIETVNVITGPFPIGPGQTWPGFTMTNPTAWSDFLIGRTRPTSKNAANPWAEGGKPKEGAAMNILGSKAPDSPPSSYGITQSMFRGFYFNSPTFNLIDDLDYNNPEHLQILADRHGDLGVVDLDISAFKKAGGKLILWAGLGENAVPPSTEIESYKIMKKIIPGTDDFVRLYLAPGVYHCAGGPGPQDTPDRLLDKVIDWVEQGKRPDEVVASAWTPTPGSPLAAAPPIPSRTVLLCPYPQTAVFSAKKGAFPYDAANWSCK